VKNVELGRVAEQQEMGVNNTINIAATICIVANVIATVESIRATHGKVQTVSGWKTLFQSDVASYWALQAKQAKQQDE